MFHTQKCLLWSDSKVSCNIDLLTWVFPPLARAGNTRDLIGPFFFRFDWLKYFLGFACGDSLFETAAMREFVDNHFSRI